ncbi:MAG: glutamate synthase-related protein, partial [Synechococcaceae cyanobacterium]|nr:glutamate synthase-related protein [Synechococcaceae cyanobacterium]
MTLPLVASGTPVSVDLQSDREYLYCICGRSDDQPFCDGSHRGTDLEPLPFQVDEDGPALLCRCKQTADPPFCDGSHTAVPQERVGTEFRLDRSGGSSAAPSPRATEEEPHLEFIHALARDGLTGSGPEGPVAAMGVPRSRLPDWDDLQILTAQLARRPLEREESVGTELVIGPAARKPLRLAIPVLVTDMSFGALSEEAKLALARGAEAVGTAICSGEGGLLPEELEASRRCLFELGPARHGYSEELLERVQAFHFKAGQAAKTGVGGHLPAAKVTERIAAIRGIQAGETAHSPAGFPDLATPEAFARFADRVRERSGGIPVGFKMSAQHIEADLDVALEAGADYIVLDGRGGGTGAAPLLFRDHISVPTIPALARAR